ncbi:MAG TPA: tetratricopeptide repeat protein, partial [Thermodesulfobacteriota bacterium]|nr:tetratricopeptide repeat protein [Thermodesulfobacteriota bacterium]
HRAADILKRSSHIDKAQKLYERILNMDSKDELALRRLTEFNVEDGAVDQAIDIYERMLRSNPNDFKILKKAIEVYRGLGDIKKLKIYLRRLASAYKLKSQDTDIKEVYEEILSLDPFDPEAIEYMSQERITNELRIQKPLEEQMDAVIQNDFTNVEDIKEFSSPDQYSSLVDRYSKGDSNFENVLDEEDNAKELEGSPTHLSNHQEIFSKLTLDDNKISEMEVVDKTQLEDIKEGEAEVFGVLNNKGDNQEVEESREVTSELNGLSSATLNKVGKSEFFELGMMHKDKMMFEQAASEFRKSIMEGYKVWESYMMVGICFLKRGDGKTALQWFQKGLFLDGLLVNQLIALKSGSAIALGILGNYSDAIKVLEGIVAEYEKYEMR